MKLEFLSKSVDYVGGEPYQTRVVLGNSDGAVYPFFFAADFINKNNSELFELAMENIYQENFPMRAENEKFNTLGEKIAEYDALIEKANSTIDKMEKQMTNQKEQSSMAQVTLMSVIYKLYEKGMLTDEDLAETTITEAE